MALHVCVACHRHIRRNTCDFCGHLNDFAPAPLRGTTLGASTRAALVLGTAIALGACQSDTKDPEPTAEDAAYGGPPMDDGGPPIEDATPPGLDAAYGGPPIETDALPVAPAYGAPPIEDATPPGLDAAYGGPPIEDAGVVDAAIPDTGPVAAYGGPPLEPDAMPAAPAYGAPPM
jgi:hypothetical protein